MRLLGLPLLLVALASLAFGLFQTPLGVHLEWSPDGAAYGKAKQFADRSWIPIWVEEGPVEPWLSVHHLGRSARNAFRTQCGPGENLTLEQVERRNKQRPLELWISATTRPNTDPDCDTKEEAGRN